MPHSKKEMISFFLTTKCNLNCIYCYTNKSTFEHKSQTINLDFAKAGIDDYYETNYRRHIRFFGAGEPTEEFDLMKNIFYYAKSKDFNTTAEIQTNGCFSEEIAKWLAWNIDIIWISSDGTPEIQDYFRPMLSRQKSSEMIEQNIKYLIKNKCGMVGIRSTITESNYDKQIHMIKYFSKLGIKNFWVDPVFPSIGETENHNRWTFDMGRFTEKFIEAVKYAYSRGMTYGSILTCNFDEPGQIACRALLPVPHLTSDGYVSACDMALFGKDNNHMNVFIYGKWDNDNKRIIYFPDKIELLRSRVYKKMEKCSKCSVGPFCRGYCPGEVTNETGSIFGCKTIICNPTKIIFNRLTNDEKKYFYFHP